MNNFEKIKNKSVAEMVGFIHDMVKTADCKNCPAYNFCDVGDDCKESIAGWLMEEAI